MSEYENVVGKLRLKGNALHVKGGGITKKKKQKNHYEQSFTKSNMSAPTASISFLEQIDFVEKTSTEHNVDAENKVTVAQGERLTPAERRYLEQWKQLEVKRLLEYHRITP